MDNVSISKYGWIIFVIILASLFGLTAPSIGETINDKIIDKVIEEEMGEAYTVILDAQGGTTEIKKLLVANGKPYGYLPTPVQEGKVFLGWYTAQSGGTQITSQTIYQGYSHHTIYALWQ